MDVVERGAVADMATERLEAELVSWAARLAAATATWLVVLAEYDRRRGFEAWGCATCVRWLSWQCGLDPRSAREHLRVARALEGLPEVQAAMARGELSFSRVRAITRVAVPETEQTWLDVARQSTAAQLERAVRATRRARALQEATAAHAGRSLQWWWDDDGSLVVRGRLPADAGAALIRAIEAELVATPPAEPEADDPVAAQRADALVALVERDGADGGAEVVVHTTPAGLTGEAGRGPRRWSGGAGSGRPTAGLRRHGARRGRHRLVVEADPAGTRPAPTPVAAT